MLHKNNITFFLIFSILDFGFPTIFERIQVKIILTRENKNQEPSAPIGKKCDQGIFLRWQHLPGNNLKPKTHRVEPIPHLGQWEFKDTFTHNYNQEVNNLIISTGGTIQNSPECLLIGHLIRMSITGQYQDQSYSYQNSRTLKTTRHQIHTLWVTRSEAW